MHSHHVLCCAQSLSHVGPFATQGLQSAWLLCPWNSPGKNTGVGYHALLQGIFPTPGLKPVSTWQVGSLLTETPGMPKNYWSG